MIEMMMGAMVMAVISCWRKSWEDREKKPESPPPEIAPWIPPTPPVNPLLNNPMVLVRLAEERRRLLESYNRPGPLWSNSLLSEGGTTPRIDPMLFGPSEESPPEISLPSIPATQPMAWQYQNGRRIPMGR